MSYVCGQIRISMKKYQINNPAKNQLNEAFELTYAKVPLESFFNNILKISELIEKGLSFQFFKSLSQKVPFTEEEWADILNLSTKSLQRYRTEKNFLFKPIHAEKIMEITEVTYLGLDVFDNPEQFKMWLKTDNFALGNHKPQDLLRNSYGKDLVINELNRIQHGIFV